ncbi:hypothetical protein A7982_12234 [Minicystis rosea]|nr:hypothetical protein A7982_12234 [Minicystis rosea]
MRSTASLVKAGTTADAGRSALRDVRPRTAITHGPRGP